MKGPAADASRAAHRIVMPPHLMGGGPVDFTADHVAFKGTRILYDDVTSIKYNLTKDYLRFIPAYQGLYYRVAARDKEIFFFLKPHPATRIRDCLPVFAHLVNATKKLVEPVLVRNLASQLLDHGGRLTFAGVAISRAGMEKESYFSGKSLVPWSDKLHKPEFSEGKVLLFRDNGGVPVVFASVPLELDNAAVLPELVRALHDRANAC